MPSWITAALPCMMMLSPLEVDACSHATNSLQPESRHMVGHFLSVFLKAWPEI